MTTAAVSDHTEYRPFATFSFVWGISTLIHQLAFTFWTESWEGWVLVLAAIALIHRPDCVLRFAIHASQGEFPRVVLAPGDRDDAFHLTWQAFNLADVLQTPVIILGAC